ncbi:hypothetical protein F4553_000766 [Allocatelliglobosispora scoriae]|uniref:Uncharacterized protein n=1 Tax=Allocatelliglobosispora scoriae TaxID=643052 RepID=A0A841BE73_9ACTN|nr:hypothetical protein [Allocatelliglobosispora scoriae]MBB5867387.1 hypothetical protein [Allocatelliglobosispora scoriae]
MTGFAELASFPRLVTAVEEASDDELLAAAPEATSLLNGLAFAVSIADVFGRTNSLGMTGTVPWPAIPIPP